MRQGEMKTIAVALVMDRDAKISNENWSRLFNDHANRILAEATERTTVFTFASISLDFSTGKWRDQLLQTSILRILEATLETATNTLDGIPLRIVTPEAIRHERRRSTAVGVPRLIAFERIRGTSGRMSAICHPPASQQYYVATRALIAPTDFDSTSYDATETFDSPQEQCYHVAREAAIDGGAIIGRPAAFLDSITSRAQQLEQDQQGRLADLFGPRFPRDEPL